MKKWFQGMLPHCAILICNMYIVFFLIDRVNTAMVFIDNDITKGLLAAMCLISIWCSALLMKKKRRRGRGLRRFIAGINMLACVGGLLLIAADYIWLRLLIFNGAPAKIAALAVCLITLLNGAVLIACNRAAVRRLARKRQAVKA